MMKKRGTNRSCSSHSTDSLLISFTNYSTISLTPPLFYPNTTRTNSPSIPRGGIQKMIIHPSSNYFNQCQNNTPDNDCGCHGLGSNARSEYASHGGSREDGVPWIFLFVCVFGDFIGGYHRRRPEAGDKCPCGPFDVGTRCWNQIYHGA